MFKSGTVKSKRQVHFTSKRRNKLWWLWIGLIRMSCAGRWTGRGRGKTCLRYFLRFGVFRYCRTKFRWCFSITQQLCQKWANYHIWRWKQEPFTLIQFYFERESHLSVHRVLPTSYRNFWVISTTAVRVWFRAILIFYLNPKTISYLPLAVTSCYISLGLL